MKIFSIKNEKLSFFNRPIYVESAEEALSYIQNILMSDADRALLGLKDDLSLVYLGDIDFVTGKIDPCKKPVTVTPLADIFATIPEDQIPRNERYFMEEIEKLKKALSELLTEVHESKIGGAFCADS